jgi:hypothetical protein
VLRADRARIPMHTRNGAIGLGICVVLAAQAPARQEDGMSETERKWLIVERENGRVDAYEFEDEHAARAGAAAYIGTDAQGAVGVRVAPRRPA